MRAPEAVKALSNQTAVTSTQFELHGGVYVMDIVATGTGTVTLQRLGPNGTTFLVATAALTATGPSPTLYLPPGQYNVVTAGLTAVYATIARVPFE